MTALVWHSSFATLTGYSGSAVRFVLGLDERGVAVRPLYLYGADHDEYMAAGHMHPRIRTLQAAPVRLDIPQVVYAPGDRFSKNSGAYRIGFTMVEVDRMTPSWVAQSNQMDEVWTPTLWGAEVLHASGVQRPIVVVPLGIDPVHFQPGLPRTVFKDRTVFLSVFDWGIRKGWDLLLRAYCAAFQANAPVLLVLKVDCTIPIPSPVAELARALPPGSPPVALVYNQPFTTVQMVDLYRSADCFVLPSRGEGWGMPILEAMACGTPAIATDWSAQTTFLNDQNGYPLRSRRLVPAEASHPYYRDAQWAEPDEAMLVELFQHVAAHPEERQRKGVRAAQDAAQWTWARGIDVISERLAKIGAS